MQGRRRSLLLCHHHFLFVSKTGLWHAIGLYGKLCVAMFVFLSGYGLYRSWRGVVHNYFRLIRLYANYWIVAAIFIVLSACFFGRGLHDVYQDRWPMQFLLEIVGIEFSNSFNPTWWYMGTAVALCVVFPFVRWLSGVCPAVLLGLSIVFSFLPFRPGPWLAPFAVGVIFAHYNVFDRLNACVRAPGRILDVIGFLGLLSYARFVMGDRYDWVLSATIVSLLYVMRWTFVKRGWLLWRLLSILGVYSMNIFLLHTFILAYFFPDFFRSLHPAVGLLVLTVVSTACAVAIEIIKDKSGFNRIVSKLVSMQDVVGRFVWGLR